LRENVLPRVLLNHLAPPRPVNYARYLFPRRQQGVAVEPVQNSPVIGHHNINHICRADLSPLTRLPAAGRVKGGLVNRDYALPSLQPGISNASAELCQV